MIHEIVKNRIADLYCKKNSGDTSLFLNNRIKGLEMMRSGIEKKMGVIEPSHRKLEELKAKRICEIEAYDTSEAVNGFTYQGQTMWIDKATRVGLVNAIECTMTMGEEEVTFGINDVSVTLPCATAMKMMAALEVYALKCYNVTLAHKNAVMALTSKEEIEAYDITAGYPEKLAF